MPVVPQVSPEWWRQAALHGRPVREILSERDMGALFQFLKTRGWSRAAIASATGLTETRVRAIHQGKQQVASYDVLERIAAGLGIDRGLLGLAYADGGVTREPAAPAGADLLRDPSLDPDFVGSLAAMAVGSIPRDIARLLPPAPSPADDVPALVTRAHVGILQEVAERHRRFDANQGGGSCRDSAVAYLRWA